MNFEFVYGVQPVLQVLSIRKRRGIKLFIHRSQLSSDFKKILSIAEKEKIPLEEKDKAQLSKLSNSTQHQGVVLKTEPFSYSSFEKLLSDLSTSQEALILMLDQIQDPQNLGAILRTAACAGVRAVILPERGSALVTPTVLKSSAGAAELVSISLVTNLARSLEELKKIPVWIYGADATSPSIYSNQEYPPKTALVLGGEGSGIRSLIQKKCDFLISIPLFGKISSLNVSVAAGILMFEIRRQKRILS